MKNRNRILSFVLAFIMIFNFLCIGAFANEGGQSLKFNGGSFRIMHITDTHYTDFPFEESIAFIGKALDDYQPDLVIFGGDNIKGWFGTSMQLGVKAAIDKLVAPVAERNIPFSFIYGNHDWEAYLCPKQLQNKFYGAYDNCIVPDGFSSISRSANGNILIKDSNGEKDIFNIWLFDSGTKIKMNGNSTVQGVNSAEIKWYEKKCAELKEANGGNVIPAIAFQHFPVEETTKLFVEDENGFACGEKTFSLKPGITDEIINGEAGAETSGITTHLNKSCEIPSENSGEYSAFIEQGDVIGLFTGHAHVNDFCGITQDNIILGSTLSAGGFNISSRFEDSEGNPVEARGVRIIDIDEKALTDGDGDNLEAISTFSVYYSDYFTDSLEKYPQKYKAFDEHDFGEWIKIEFKYLIDFLKSL
ncbi:MAG: metallophosphoesterase [Clostridia bacterium]|nr:metallophosphoesterase [Clostridia bacterium]